jgi:hypothetical protein
MYTYFHAPGPSANSTYGFNALGDEENEVDGAYLDIEEH